MHSSRMRTARSSSRLQGGVPASVHAGIHPLGVDLETPPPGQTPQAPPWMRAWKPTRHAGIPPPGDLQGMLGYHLQGILGYPPDPPWTEFLTHASESITFSVKRMHSSGCRGVYPVCTGQGVCVSQACTGQGDVCQTPQPP